MHLTNASNADFKFELYSVTAIYFFRTHLTSWSNGITHASYFGGPSSNLCPETGYPE